jgi:hypothetical protein
LPNPKEARHGLNGEKRHNVSGPAQKLFQDHDLGIQKIHNVSGPEISKDHELRIRPLIIIRRIPCLRQLLRRSFINAASL